VDLEGGSGVLASYKQVAPRVDLKHDRELHVETLTLIHHRLTSQSGRGSLNCLFKLDVRLSS